MGIAVVFKRWLAITAVIVVGVLGFPVLALITTVLTGLMTIAVVLLVIARGVGDRLPAFRGPRASRDGTTFGFRD